MTWLVHRRLTALGLFIIASQPGRAPRKSSESIDRVASLRTARAAHTATALGSGHVLIVGGMATDGGSLAAVELFDPATNTIQQLAPLAESRVGHTATLLGDGRLLIAGGYNGEYLSSLEIFDPSTRRFAPAGSLTEPRSGHTATLLPDGRVLFAGGIGPGWSFLSTAELYDPATRRSVAVGSMSVARESHTATLLADGRVLIVGGHRGRRQNMEVYASMEAFSPQTLRFLPAGVLAIARHKHDALRLQDGRVLIIGGADRSDRIHYETTEIYDPRTETIAKGPTMAYSRYKIAGTSVLLPSGEVLVTAGARAAELLDVDSRSLREIPGRFPEEYHFAAAALLPQGDVVIVGGYSDANENTAGVWRFRANH
jgi:hypothetical protein